MKWFREYIVLVLLSASWISIGQNTACEKGIVVDSDSANNQYSHEELLLVCNSFVFFVETGSRIPSEYNIVGGCIHPEQFLRKEIDLDEIENNVAWTLKLLNEMPCKFSRNEMEALCSFSHHVGVLTFKTSYLYEQILKCEFEVNKDEIIQGFLKYSWIEGRKGNLLLKRRTDEYKHFFNND